MAIEPSHGFTFLHAAAYHGNLKACKAFVFFGCDTNVCDFRGQTPLHLALQQPNLEIVEYLIDGTDLSCADSMKMTPLLQAAASGNYKAWVKIRQKQETSWDLYGNNDVHLASAIGNLEIV